MKKLILIISAMFVVALVGCEEKPPAEQADSVPTMQAEPSTDEPPAIVADETAKPAAAKVTVEKAGAKIDPPVTEDQIPDGAWYCKMKTVHWASIDKPADGKCPVCKMDLVQKEAGHGHDHGEHGHEH